MRRIQIILLSTLCFLLFLTSLSFATPVLYEYAFNIDGVLSNIGYGDPVPSEVDVSSFDDYIGFGSILVTVTGIGAHSVDAFFDHEIDGPVNTWFNEYGNTVGSASAGQTWEIDEPGWSVGDIYDNFSLSTLDNYNAIPDMFPDDVSMAMGWDFILEYEETATIILALSPSIDEMISDFYLSQTDPDNVETFYLSSTLSIEGGDTPAPVPEPCTFVLLLSSFIGCIGFRRKRFSSR